MEKEQMYDRKQMLRDKKKIYSDLKRKKVVIVM